MVLNIQDIVLLSLRAELNTGFLLLSFLNVILLETNVAEREGKRAPNLVQYKKNQL